MAVGGEMFTGLTWFGIPFEYLLRLSELMTALSFIFYGYLIYERIQSRKLRKKMEKERKRQPPISVGKPKGPESRREF